MLSLYFLKLFIVLFGVIIIIAIIILTSFLPRNILSAYYLVFLIFYLFSFINLDAYNSTSNNPIFHQIRCKQFSLIHTNIRSLKSNLENFQTHLLDKLDFPFSIIGVTETQITNANFTEFYPSFPWYNFEFLPTPLSAGGVGMTMYIENDTKYTVIEKNSNEAFQALWVKLHFSNTANIICSIVYWQHNSPEQFQKYFKETSENLSASETNTQSITTRSSKTG